MNHTAGDAGNGCGSRRDSAVAAVAPAAGANMMPTPCSYAEHASPADSTCHRYFYYYNHDDEYHYSYHLHCICYVYY